MKFIKIPFASSGDKTSPPATDSGGGVNYTQGYPSAYSLDPATNPSAKRIERELMNGLFNDLSTAVNEVQVNGVAPFITTSDNGGSPFAYGVGAIVIYQGNTYMSLVAGNTATPPTNGSSNAQWARVLSGAWLGNGSGQIPTMANYSSGANWVKFPDGTVIQTGVSGAGNLGSPTDIVLPIFFSTQIWSIVASFDNAVSGANDCPSFAATPLGLGAFRLMSSRPNGSSTAFARWIAIGR